MALTNEQMFLLQQAVSQINQFAAAITNEGNAATQLMTTENVERLNENLKKIQQEYDSIITVAP